MTRTLLLFATIAIGFSQSSCHPRTIATGNPANETNPGKILFLAYEVTRDSVSGKISTKILYQKTTNGSVKEGSIENATDDTGNWQVAITNNKNVAIQSVTLENPLHKKLEYVGADGKLGMKDVWLKRAEVTVRMNYKKEMEKVSLLEIGTDKKNQTIFTHSILLTDK
ncbi:MAG: hypothetical protein ABIR18_13510 [Chitinophagaceae bacterium]